MIHRFSDLLDDYVGELPALSEETPLSPIRIKALTMEKIKQADKKTRRFPAKTLLIAAVVTMALIGGTLAVSRSMFSAARGRVRPELQPLYETAEKAAETGTPTYIPMPELDLGELALRESYYDGENLLLGVDIRAVTPEIRRGYGPGCEHFDDLETAFVYSEDGDDLLEHLVRRNPSWQEDIDRLEEEGRDYLKHASAMLMDEHLRERLKPEEYASFSEALRADGHAGLVYREIYIGDHILLPDGTDLGRPAGQIETEYGTVIEVRDLPEAVRGLEEITVVLKVKSSDVYCYMDLDTGAKMRYITVGEALIPVTVPITE